MKYTQLKNGFMQDELSKLFKKHKVFFAFSNEQLEKRLIENNIDKNEPLTRIVSGGLVPKKNATAFLSEFEKLHDNMIEEIKKLDPEPIINYELANYESWYTGDITDAYEVLKDYGYTREQVIAVYRKYAKDRYND